MCIDSGSATPTVVEIFCGVPNQLPLTVVTSTGLDLRSIATYTCEEGYTPSVGVATSQCTTDGTWTSVNIECHRTLDYCVCVGSEPTRQHRLARAVPYNGKSAV